MPRFVILRHEAGPGCSGPSHWDLMFEVPGVLRTWSAAHLPGPRPRMARLLDDHRLDYLEYEGPVSRQRGSVRRWDQGTYTVLAETPERWVLQLAGVQLVGQLTLTCTSRSRREWEVFFVAGRLDDGAGADAEPGGRPSR